MSRPVAVTMTAATAAVMAFAVVANGDTLAQGEHERIIGTGVVRFDGRGAEAWARRYRQAHAELLELRAQLKRRWQPTVDYALRLASAVTGVPYGDLSAVAWCESRHNPFASNGRYRGLFQLGWAPFGMSAFDPVANALSAAVTVRRDGGWGQWSCRP